MEQQQKRMSFSPMVCSTCLVLMMRSLEIILRADAGWDGFFLSLTSSTLPKEPVPSTFLMS